MRVGEEACEAAVAEVAPTGSGRSLRVLQALGIAQFEETGVGEVWVSPDLSRTAATLVSERGGAMMLTQLAEALVRLWGEARYGAWLDELAPGGKGRVRRAVEAGGLRTEARGTVTWALATPSR